jgi:hypothetical protein
MAQEGQVPYDDEMQELRSRVANQSLRIHYLEVGLERAENLLINPSPDELAINHATSLHNGNFSPMVMRMIGRVPIEAPTGFQLRKIEYSVPLNACNDFVATYRLDGRNQGKIVMISTGSRSYKNINEDGAGGSGIADDHKLVEGDMIIGAILRVVDGRNDQSRTGTVSAGIVPVATSNAETALGTSGTSDTILQMYGKFANPRTAIAAESIGAPLMGPSNSCTTFGVADFARDPAFIKTCDLDTASNSYLDTLADPVLAVSVQGIATASDATNIIVHLSVFALLGPRDGQHNIPMRSLDPETALPHMSYSPEFANNPPCSLKCFRRIVMPDVDGPTFTQRGPSSA